MKREVLNKEDSQEEEHNNKNPICVGIFVLTQFRWKDYGERH